MSHRGSTSPIISASNVTINTKISVDRAAKTSRKPQAKPRTGMELRIPSSIPAVPLKKLSVQSVVQPLFVFSEYLL